MAVKNETVEVIKKSTKTANTNWGAFERAGLVPTELMCQGYQPIHRADMSCHTRLTPAVENMIAHLKNDHGGGFKVTVKKTEGKPWAGWNDLKEAGVECFDLRCDVCDAVVPFHPQHLMNHMRGHSGKNRRIQTGGIFWMTISLGSTTPNAEDTYAEME